MKTNAYTANQDIRDYMADHGVTQKTLSEYMGFGVAKINPMLKTELSEKDKENIIRVIDAMTVDKVTEEHQESTDDAEEVEKAEEPAQIAVTNTTKYQLGDRVKVASRHSIIGTVSDIWHSLVQDSSMYAVDLENGSRGLYAENQLEPAPIPITYSWEDHIDGNVAVVTMNATQGDKTWVYSRGHAHILHDGEVGMAQAVSYAARRMFEALDTQQKDRIYVKEERR